MIKKLAITFILGICIGVVATFFLWQHAVARLDLPPQHEVFSKLAIHKPTVIGFLPYWLISKTDDHFADNLTTLTYFGLVVNTDGHILTRVSKQEPEIGYTQLRSEALQKKFSQAREKNITLSLLVYNQDEASISAIMSEPELHAKNLMADLDPIMREHHFSDLNIDIESFREASPSARVQFTQFLQTIRQEVDQRKLGTLSIDLSPDEVLRPYLYEPEKIGQLVDKFVLMAYDFNYRGSFVTGPVAPLGGAGEVRTLDIPTSVTKLKKVVPAEKIILGIPTYGYQWETLSANPYSPTLPSSGATATYRRVSDLIKGCTNCQVVADPVSQQPYVISPTPVDGVYQQIFYEDGVSLRKKLDFAQQEKLDGVALWALGYEYPELVAPLGPYKKSFTSK